MDALPFFLVKERTRTSGVFSKLVDSFELAYDSIDLPRKV